jgi:short-subunit dehydrogenase
VTSFKNALITGASSGIGRGLAAHYAKAGVRVFAAARRTAQLESLKAEAGSNIEPLTLDIADSDATEARVRALDKECGGLDLVIANAGIGEVSNGKRIAWEPISRMLKINVLGSAATICGALPGMVERGRGHVVGMSSSAALAAPPKMGAYSGTKAFLTRFLEGLRLDVEPLGLKVSIIQPGYVKSEMTASFKKPPPFLLETEDAVQRIVKAIGREERTFTFPWQVSLTLRTVKALPRPLSDAALKKMR